MSKVTKAPVVYVLVQEFPQSDVQWVTAGKSTWQAPVGVLDDVGNSKKPDFSVVVVLTVRSKRSWKLSGRVRCSFWLVVVVVTHVVFLVREFGSVKFVRASSIIVVSVMNILFLVRTMMWPRRGVRIMVLLRGIGAAASSRVGGSVGVTMLAVVSRDRGSITSMQFRV